MIIYCTRELEWVIVCDEDKSMICTSECVKDVHMDGYILLGRGKVLIMSDSDCTRTFVWNISVWRRTRFVPFIFHCMINYCSTFISFWKKILNLTVFGFLALDGFHFFFIFSNIDQEKKCQQRHYIFGVCSSWPGFSFKMCNFSEFDEDWRSEQHIK